MHLLLFCLKLEEILKKINFLKIFSLSTTSSLIETAALKKEKMYLYAI